MKLGTLLLDTTPYRPSAAVYAELLDGRFSPPSRARVGDETDEESHLLDGLNFFCRCDLADIYLTDCAESGHPPEECVLRLINEINLRLDS